MKFFIKCIIVLILSAIIFTGCSSTAGINSFDTYIEGQDSQENFINYNNDKFYASNGESYYFLHKGFLYEIDKKTQKCHPMCNKSDCLHDNELSSSKRLECNANLNISDDKIVYNNGYLYYFFDDEEYDKDGNKHMVQRICRISTDNGTKEIIYTTEDYSIFNIRAHRGYLYLNLCPWNSNGEAGEEHVDLFRISLDGKSDPELFISLNDYRKKYKNMWITETRFYGNHLFYKIEYTKNKKSKVTFINVDLNNGKWTDIGSNLPLKDNTRLTIFNDKLIFNSTGTKICECNFNGKNVKEILDCSNLIQGYNFFAPYCNDGQNLIISMAKVNPKDIYDVTLSKRIIFCDKKYKAVIHDMPIKCLAEIGFDKDFFIYLSDDEDAPVYLIDKNRFKMKKIYEFPIQE